jgi:hypothetical protein
VIRGQALVEALAAAAAALEAGDPQAAGEALSRAHSARQALQDSGTALAPEELARARALFGVCQAAAARIQDRLGAALGLAGRSSRARAAYRR